MQSVLSKAPTVARLFLGLLFTVFGLNGFFGFLPMPDPTPEGGAFLGALAATGYMFPLIKGTEVISGLLLLSNRFVPLAITLLAPVTVNIFAYHLLLAPSPGMPIAIIAAQLFLAYTYRAAFRPMLQSKVEATASSEAHSASASRPLRAQSV